MKTKVFATILICGVLLVTGISCKGGLATIDGMTGEQLLDNVLAASESLDSCKLYMTSEMQMMGTSMTVNGYGAIDEDSQAMYMDMQMDMGELGDATSKIYIVDEWVYMEITGMGWVKMELTEDMWEQQDVTAQQLMVLENYIDVKVVGREQISSTECYRIEVIPDMQALWEWAMGQEDIGELSFDIDFDEFFEEFTITVWIATDTFYMVQSSMDIAMKSLGRMVETITLYDFNEPVSITLPAEAADAVEWEGW